ncbi:MAG: chromosome segregation protein SMC [Peptococcales bacterium]
MYLKRLEIQGFKSFADKVELEFNSGITVVVGPNGSGKSNVVDAIRWVLGEQSAKNLRGLRMDDIIFSGSSSRRPLGLAQVSLTLDNSTGMFPLDYNEVTVTRRLYRSGESEYLINKVPCRMKDIQQLFMDTGVGKEGFSVIGQGKIDEILSLKAEDRRSLIEEAAGIVKYRYRKKEAERKLDDTQQSLLRINDIVVELREQLGPLGEQAKKAQEYQGWKKELDQWEISLALEVIEESEKKEKEIKELLRSLEDNLTESNTKYHQISSQIEKERFQNQELNQTISSLQQKYYDLNTEIERQEHSIEMFQERIKGILAQLGRITTDLENYHHQEETIFADIEGKRNQLQKLNLDYKNALDIVQKLTIAFSEQKGLQSNSSSTLEEYKSQVIEFMQEKANINNLISKLDNEINLLGKRNILLEEKKVKLSDDLEKLKEQFKVFKEDKENLLRIKISYEAEQLQLERYLTDLNFNLARIKKDLEQKKLNYQQVASRLQVLEEMEETGDGYQQGVKSILELKNKNNTLSSGIIGTVADIISVPKEMEVALETALGGALQNLITDDDQAAQRAINYLKLEKRGRATFLPLNTIKFQKANIKVDFPGVVGRAVDLINFEAKYEPIVEHLLGRVWVIKNLEALVAIGKKTNFAYRMVTLDGEIINPGGALTGGSFRKQKTGLLTRKRLIKELKDEICLLNQKINQIEQTIKIKEQEQIEIINKIEKLRDNSHNNQLNLADLESKEHYVQQEIKRLNEERYLYDLEQKDNEKHQIKINSEKEVLSKELQIKVDEIANLEKGINSLQESLNELAAAQDGLIKDLNEEKIKTATLEQSLELAQEQLQKLENDLQNISSAKIKLLGEKQELETKKWELEQEIQKTKKNVNSLTQQLALLGGQIQQEKEKRIELQELVSSLENEIKQKQSAIERVKYEIYQHSMKLTKVEMEIAQSRERLKEQFSCDYQEALNYRVEIQNKRNVVKRINELKGYISDLGLINFAAITEYERVNERLEFLTEQLIDLTEAKDSLLKVIKDMDKIMIKKFKETFELVNKAFNTVFTEMFGGGSASLELSDADNLLETGIEIIAEPPGKKAQTLSLLSGGERAMTAIALLFAILRIKPSPFCVLDEIEAALDEANVDRFSSFLKQYVQKTQFIVISHRKGTMEAADVLYGITIEEQTGVSKLISVRLNEAG